MSKKWITAGMASLGLSIVGWTGAASAAETVTYQASAGYSSTQQTNQWHYAKWSDTVYTDLTYQSGSNRWDNGGTYPWVNANAQHPGNDADSVRTWIAPADGTITITGSVEKGSADGDGILATIKKDNTTLWSQKVLTTVGVTPSGVNNIVVQKGTAIHFIVNKVGSISFDHTLWNPTIAFTAGTEVPDTNSLSIVEFGAVANDGKDDDAAIRAAIQAAQEQGKDVYVPEGTFQLSDILTVDSVTLKGAGKESSILTSTNPKRGSINLTGDRPELRNLAHVYQNVVERGDGENEKNSVTVIQATNFTIENILVDRASTAGILTKDSTGGMINNNTVQNTNADGIHTTGGSHNITVQNNTVQNVGDDTIAVVSYGTDVDAAGNLEPTYDVRILNNTVSDGGARGITVVGGHDVLIEGNDIRLTQMAGIYIATEGSYNTQSVNRVTVNRNRVDSTALDLERKHADILVYAGSKTIDNIDFNDNTSLNASRYAVGVWGSGGMGTIKFNNTTVVNAPNDNANKYRFDSGIVYWNGEKFSK